MKVSRLLVAVVLLSACSADRPAEQDEVAPAAERPQATVGTAETDAPAARPAPRRARPRQVAVPIEVRDERAAADGAVTQAAAAAGVNAGAAVQQDFTARVQKYLELHRDAAKGAAELEETERPAEINAAQDALAARIRTMRAGAKHGDVFTPEIRTHFRRLLAPELKGEDGRDAKALLKDDAPAAGSVPFKVNARYPSGQPLPTLPANLLLNLPTLPDPLEYRIVGRHLVLLDTDANLIVDYIPNAIR